MKEIWADFRDLGRDRKQYALSNKLSMICNYLSIVAGIHLVFQNKVKLGLGGV